MSVGRSQSGIAHSLCSVGVDKVIYRQDLVSKEQVKIEMDEKWDLTAIGVHPSGDRCCLGDRSKMIISYQFSNGQITKICDTLGFINSLQYSVTGRYLCVGSDEGKCLIIDTNSNEVYKCRPGHTAPIVQSFFNTQETIVVSIGKDGRLLMYQWSTNEQPKQVSSYSITSLSTIETLRGCFSGDGCRVYVPGSCELHVIQKLNNKWQMHQQILIHHPKEILMVACLKYHHIITSCINQVAIWNIHQHQQLVCIDQFNLLKVQCTNDTFYAVRDDGKIYQYVRQLPGQTPLEMEVQEHASQQVEQQYSQEQHQQEEESIQQQQPSEQELRYLKGKKSKADKLITCYPQGPVNHITSYYNQHRFLFINHYAIVIQSIENDHNYIQLQTNQHHSTQIIFQNRNVLYFDANQDILAYATTEEFGIKTNPLSQITSWENQWTEIQGIAIGAHWIAVTNDEQIKVFDFTGNQFKSISFDRQIVALGGYENLLVIVYHEAVPMWGSQSLSMQLYVIDRANCTFLKAVQVHVPITSQSMLRWFGFSSEGMLFSQDTFGIIRAFSFQTNQWTTVFTTDLNDAKRVWILHFQNYELKYWKTTEIQPQPTVQPRLNQKSTKIGIATLTDGSTQLQQYPCLLWHRYCLDYQKWRSRNWGRLKSSRLESSAYYNLSSSIMSQKQIIKAHMQLDYKFESILKYYIKNGQTYRALYAIKSLIRTIKAGKKYIQLFDDLQMRDLAIELQYHYDQRQKELQYESLQLLQCEQLKASAENMVKPQPVNPMRKGNNKKIVQDIPSLSISQNSQVSSELLSNTSSQILQQQSEPEFKQQNNPFLKRSNHNDIDMKKKIIQEQINHHKKKNNQQTIQIYK